MLQIVEANWLAFALALLIGLLVAWWLFGRTARVSARRERRPDVLDEGAAPAQRNQTLIDAPPAAAPVQPAPVQASVILPAPVSVGMAGVGEVVAVAATEEADVATPAPALAGDDLRRIKGVGPKLVALLHTLGVTHYAQIAGWTEDDVSRMDAQLGGFSGRIRRDNWVEQARLLATGDTAGFESKFGKL